ncbi:MAG: pentapeptide repeat-containing protein [Thiogranum sp.]|nr:pentapeptide repeat-containing protein [Thiogranum sp.]
MSHQNPEIKDDPMYRLLREGEVEEFNARRASGETCDLTGCDFRTLDLRKLHARGLDLRDCYFRQSDLRGVDLSEANLEGASINAAKISGVYFPRELSADEIMLSLTHGTRMRYRKD